ncbi:hypothetical protein [Nocardia sp. NPDC004722]
MIIDETAQPIDPGDLGIKVGQDSAPELKPRSVKLSDELDRRATRQAVHLGLSKSAYIRRLIEQDLAANEYRGEAEPEPAASLADLVHIRAELDRVITRLRHTA